MRWWTGRMLAGLPLIQRNGTFALARASATGTDITPFRSISRTAASGLAWFTASMAGAIEQMVRRDDSRAD
jgi:hypothetical protein